MPASFGKKNNIVYGQLLALHEVDEHTVEAFESNWLVFQNQRHMVRCNERIGKSEADQPPIGWAGLQMQRGSKHCNASTFAAYKRARHVKTVLRQQLVKVVP